MADPASTSASSSPVLSAELRDVADRNPEWVVDHSADRTLVARARPGSPVVHLFKIFERGSTEDALREIRLGYRVQHENVVQYEDAGIDPITGRPCVVMRYHQGLDLEQAVARHGPFPLAAALRIARDLALTLDHLHTLRVIGDAPHGIVHRDVKPRNVILREGPGAIWDRPILLVDFEHACPVPPPQRTITRTGQFTGGTHGYAPPEAYASAPPTPVFDLFATGAVLWFLLTGGAPFGASSGDATARRVRHGACRPLARVLPTAPAWVEEAIRACLAADPARRPASGRVLAERLAQDVGAAGEPAAQRALELFRAGDCAAAAMALAPGSQPAGEHMARAGRVLARVPARIAAIRGQLEEARSVVATQEPPAPALRAACTALTRALGFLGATLARHPQHADCVALKNDAVAVACRVIGLLPEQSAHLRKATAFRAAEDLIQVGIGLALALRRLPPVVLDPRGRQLQDVFAGRDSTRARRDLLTILQATLAAVSSDHARHGDLLVELTRCEEKLDFEGARAVLDRVAEGFSGANEATAALRERLQRMRWYALRFLEMSERTTEVAREAQAFGVEVELAALEELFSLLRRNLGSEPLRRTPPGIAVFHKNLQEFLREFPAAESTVGAARATLDDFLNRMTLKAHALLVEIQGRLVAEPIPVRHLQDLLRKVDRILVLDAVIDRPDKSRVRFREEVETVRIAIDEAIDRRDRITEGARESLKRGHVTTALFDLQRAAETFADAPGEAASVDGQIRRDLEEARRVKEVLETAARRNVELASLYAKLVDHVPGDFGERLLCLSQREKALVTLLKHLPEDRAAQYAQDLRDVHVAMLSEKAQDAERRIEVAQGPHERLQIAKDALQDLGGGAPEETTSLEIGGRVRRLQETWESRLARAQREVNQIAERLASERQERRRRRLLALARVVAGLSVVIAVWLVARSYFSPHPFSELAHELRDRLRRECVPEASADGRPLIPSPQPTTDEIVAVADRLRAHAERGADERLRGCADLAAQIRNALPGVAESAEPPGTEGAQTLVALCSSFDQQVVALTRDSDSKDAGAVREALARLPARALEVARSIALRAALASGSEKGRAAARAFVTATGTPDAVRPWARWLE